MRVFHVLLCLALLFPAFSNAQQILPPTKVSYFQLPDGYEDGKYLPGHVIFKLKEAFRNSVSGDRINDPVLQAAFSRISAYNIQRKFPHSPRPERPYNELGEKMADLSLIFEMEYDQNSGDIETVINYLLHSQKLAYAEPVYFYELFYDPADPDTGTQYYLAQCKVKQAWDHTKGDSAIKIGFIDTGTSFVHPELANKFSYNWNDTIDGIDNDGDGYIDNFRGWDFVGDCLGCSPDNNPSFACGKDHGVIVSGCAVAEPDNNNCLAGIGFNTSHIGLKVVVNCGDVIVRGYEAIVYGADHGINILNLSWGGTAFSSFGLDAVTYATVNHDVLLVAAGGNTPGNYRFFPACFDNVIGVAGCDWNDDIWFSANNFGSTYNNLLDITAPSINIHTTAQNNICGGVGWGTGTSLAAPLVCAAAALVKAYDSTLTNRQAGERVRIGADKILYTQNPQTTYSERLGYGRLDVENAILNNSPSVRVLKYELDDDDNMQPDQGDTISLRVKFLNYLNPTGNLTITASSSNSNIVFLDNSRTVGSLFTLDTTSLYLAPFKFRILGGASNNSVAYIKFEFKDDAGYDDYQYIFFVIGESFEVMDGNKIETSVDGVGRFGYHTFPSRAIGRGLAYDSNNGVLAEGGFLVGKSASSISENIRIQSGTSQSNDFNNVSPIKRDIPGKLADLQTHTIFNDNGASSPMNLSIEHNGYQYSDSADDDFIIFEYNIANDGSSAQNSLYAGIYGDWDMAWWDKNHSAYDSIGDLAYIWEDNLTSYYYTAVGLITPDSLHGFADSIADFSYTKADKWAALSSPYQMVNSDTGDIFQIVSGGPFNVAAGDTHTIAFFICAGKDLTEVRQAAQSARDKYYCVIRGQIPKVSLGDDILVCDGNPITLDAGSGYDSYSWTGGGSNQSLSVSSSGDYKVVVTDTSSGCSDYDEVNIRFGESANAGITVSSTSIFVGDTVWFSDTTSNILSRSWDFGDGSPMDISASPYHVYNANGTFTVTYIGSKDCYCNDTLTSVIQVDTMVGRLRSIPAPEVSVFPNPANDKLHFNVSLNRPEMISWAIYSLRGERIMLEDGIRNGNADIDVSELSKGLYLIRISGENWQVSRRFVKGGN